MRKNAAVELPVVEMRRKRFRLKDPLKIVGIALPDDQYEIGIIGRGFEFVHAALAHENQFVFPGAEFLFVDRAVDGAVDDVQNLDAAVKMRQRIVMLAFEKFDRVRFVVEAFVNDVSFHNVNIWQMIVE